MPPSPSLLLISADPHDQIFASEVATVAGLSFKNVENHLEGARETVNGNYAIILVDGSVQKTYEIFENSLQESVGLFSDKLNSNFIHFLSSEDLANVEYLRHSPLFGHFVLKNYRSSPAEAGRHYGRVVKTTLAERAFGLDKVLGPSVKIQKVKLSSSTQKADAVEAIRAYAAAAKLQDRIAGMVAAAVDELLLNAIYDAPVDALGKSLYSNVPRSTVLELSGNSEVEISLGFDGNYIAVAVTDHHGSLNKAKLLAHLSKAYVKEEYKVKVSVAGAGIGLSNVFRSGASFFFVSEAGAKTEVTVFFKRSESFRGFRDQFRFISTQFYV